MAELALSVPAWLLSLLACPSCRTALVIANEELMCSSCRRGYATHDVCRLFPDWVEEKLGKKELNTAWSRWHEAIDGLTQWRKRRAVLAKEQPSQPRTDGVQTDRLVNFLVEMGVHGTVVDVGAKDGGRYQQLPSTVQQYIGVDPFAAISTVPLTRDDRSACLVQAVAEALPLKNSIADAVVCFSAFDYFPEPQIALAEMKRVLKPAGTLIVMVSVVDPVVAKARDADGVLQRLGYSLVTLPKVGVKGTANLVARALTERQRPHTHYYTRNQVIELISLVGNVTRVEQSSTENSEILYIAAKRGN